MHRSELNRRSASVSRIGKMRYPTSPLKDYESDNPDYVPGMLRKDDIKMSWKYVAFPSASFGDFHFASVLFRQTTGFTSD